MYLVTFAYYLNNEWNWERAAIMNPDSWFSDKIQNWENLRIYDWEEISPQKLPTDNRQVIYL